ncbi:MAG: alkaline phosphatase family protein [Acidimicrobiia bacterium]|nr:alkaline phosphatase family protein [Acidimicrobiia bacterium]MDH3398412.1 alkaline phosphatase family protein [Acidimicrobiia bacterium]
MRPPDYHGGGLVNLIAELEHRLTGSSAAPRLRVDLAARIPPARSYVFVLIDGLGNHQLDHPAAALLARDRVGAIDASFSTQTTVNTSTLATGLPPSQHGLIAYLLRLNERVVNTIFWFDPEGQSVDIDCRQFLPTPNLAERMSAAGVESIVVEPAAFIDSPLDRLLYRGATMVPAEDDAASVRIALERAAQPKKLVAVYVPHVDAAAHAAGQESDLYRDALGDAADIWKAIAAGLPPHAVAVGTADHGHVDVTPEKYYRLPDLPDMTFYGDSRVVYVSGAVDEARALASELPVSWVSRSDMDGWWGPPPYHPEFEHRRPDGALVANNGFALLYPGNEGLMVGQHGGLTEAELRIPILVATPGR